VVDKRRGWRVWRKVTTGGAVCDGWYGRRLVVRLTTGGMDDERRCGWGPVARAKAGGAVGDGWYGQRLLARTTTGVRLATGGEDNA
jgi:hypothetical protein